MPRVRTLVVDRIFAGVGRIAVASGATTKTEKNKRSVSRITSENEQFRVQVPWFVPWFGERHAETRRPPA